MPIFIELNQSLLKGGQRLPQREVVRTTRAVARALRLRHAVSVSAAFVSAKEMRRLNAAYRGKDCVTDVLSFGVERGTWNVERGMSEGIFLGEILISYAQARRQAAELRHSTRAETLFLLVHGLLHLFGFDHERPSDAKPMFALQTRILASLAIDPRL